jgi:hypothetical protein
MPIYDLRCDACKYEIQNEWLRRDPTTEPVKCKQEGCTGHMQIRWGGRMARGTDFSPVTIEGVTYHTREEWNVRAKEIADSIGTTPDRIHLDRNEKHDRQRRADEHYARHEQKLRERGMDLQEWRERRQENRRKPGRDLRRQWSS